MNSRSNAARPASLNVHALVALCVLNHIALTGSRVAVSLSALTLGFSAFEVGLLLALFSLLPTLGAVALGRWIDRAGTRAPALSGMAAVCVGLLLPAWQLTPAMLWLAAALLGSGYSALLLAVQAQLGRCPDAAERAKAFSAFGLGMAISGSVGPLVAGQALALAGNRLAFLLLAGFALLAWGAAVLGRRRLDGPGGRAAGAQSSRPSMRQVLADPKLRRILLADLLIAIAWNANTFIVPVFGTQHGWSAAAVGLVLATFGGAVLLARALPAAWRQRLGDWHMIRFALASSSVCYLLFPFAGSLPIAFALEFVLGLGLGGALPSVLALLHAKSPADRSAEVLGVRLVALNISAVVLPMGLGGMAASLGFAGAVWCLATVFAYGAARQRQRADAGGTSNPASERT
ncbi:MFS transporter [Aquabacterium sp. A7-Y]|uniref:MFS transporter n=1 Tax=Aquabacterium sp. A7-Y TaxID=1349605 RepID=UPI00223D18A5|nr:MFS transporter [Aquabacterium sp. A7-Y]MCW7541258.1 MFS transporter [Aquabacterium sp. A7-Y]